MPTHVIDSASTDVDLTGASLAEGERVRAVFRHDLDELLRFSPGLVVLTDTHLRFGRPGEVFHSVPLQSEMRLRRTEQHGLCELVVTIAGKPVAKFCFTLREQESATNLCDAFEKQLLRVGVEPTEKPGSPAPAEAEELPEPPVRDIGRFPLIRLLGLARQRLPAVAFGGALTLAATGVGLIPPYLTMPLVDEVLVPRQASAGGEAPYHRVALILAALGLSAVLAWVLSWGQGFVVARVSERISADLRVRTFSHLTRLSLEYFGRKRTGDLIARISSDTDHLCSFLSDTLIDFVTDVLMIVGTSIVLVSLDPILALVGVGTFPVIAWLVLRIRQRLTSGFLRGGRVWSAMTNILADTIPGIRVVKAFTQESREIARFQAANADIVAANDRVNALWTFFWPLVAFLNQAGLLVIWAVGSYRVLAHRITLGVLTAFIAYISRFYARVESMSRMLTAMQKASAAARRLFEILDREPSVVDPADPVALTRMDGRVAFENVSFRYGSRLVLDDVSFEIAPRTLVGIVGHTGSGKSTVSNLLCRFYDVSAGRITVDGVDIRKFLVHDYRRHIGIVLQDAFLFFGTIADNVAYGRRDADRSQIVAAARVARAHEFVLKLPEAYDTIVGERGQTLSGGERQRLAIARALLVDPTILILDEATSAVDVKTEREIQDALDAATRGRTTIAIAHRLTTLDRADVIIVLRDGAVVEIGSRAELLARGGEFARLYRGQAEAEASETPKAADRPPEHQPLLDVPTLSFERDDDGQLCIRSTERGAGRTPVRVRRCFPLSDPGHFFAIVGHDGEERACIEDPRTLGKEVFALLEAELDGSEFLPRIERIEELRHEVAKVTWKVQTDRGLRTFAIDQDETIRRLPDGRRLVTDTDGMRYLIPAALEPASRALLSKLP